MNQNIIDLRFQIIKDMPSYVKNYKSNISRDQFKTLIEFNKIKPFKIIDTDKNTGAALISNELYIELAHSHLFDSDTYEKLDIDPTIDTFNKIENKLNDLMVSKYISKTLFKVLMPAVNNKIGKFRFLAKLHKQDFGIRPIINCKNHLTQNISIFFDNLLKPIIENSRSYIKDSQNLIQLCEKMNHKKQLELYSCDFSTLYTNIKLNDAIYYTMVSLVDNNKIDNLHVSITGLFELLNLVLNNNVFSFNSGTVCEFYKQIKGLAMGSNLGPAIANVVVLMLETKWLNIHNPKIYSRFIDDIFIASEQKIDLNEFINSFDYLKLNIIKDKKIQFLDLEIHFDSILNKLNFSLFIKKTNTFSYLNTKSNHPSHIFKNIPKSLFIRVRRICTKFNDYLYFCGLIYLHLIQCGYDARNLKYLILTVGNIDRKDLIEYKDKNQQRFKADSFNFKLKYNEKIDLKSLIKNSITKVNENNLFPNISLKSFFSVNNNIRDILIHGKQFCNFEFHNTIKCNSNRCKTCSYINNLKALKFKNGLQLPLLSSSDCFARNCIYILYCQFCDCYYIGQSSFFKSRFPSHISTIKNFKYNKCDCEIAKHFNREDHLGLYIDNLKWTIFAKNIINVKLRLSTEQEIIRLFQECGEIVINEKIYKKSVKTFLTGLKLL